MRIAYCALYFTEGAPIGFLWWTLPTVLREGGASTDRIGGLLSLLVLPWSFKFLWAPIVDALRGPRFGLRAWIAGSQAVMALALLPLLWIDASAHFDWVLGALCLHAFAAATQDVAIDGLAIRSVPPAQRGSLNAWMQAGMIGGRAAFGGGALMLRGELGDPAIVGLLVASLAVGIAVVTRLPPDEERAGRAPGERGEARTSAVAPDRRGAGRFAYVFAHLRRALAARHVWWALAFAAISGASFEGAGAMAGPFLVDHGFASEIAGRFFAGPALVATLLGALVGGRLSDRHRRRRVVAVALVATAFSVLVIAAAAGAEETDSWVWFALFSGMYLAIGAFTAASYALFMDLSDPAVGGTQFSAYMGATNLCEAWASLAAGSWIASRGYGFAFALLAAISLLGLVLLRGARLPAPTSHRDSLSGPSAQDAHHESS